MICHDVVSTFTTNYIHNRFITNGPGWIQTTWNWLTQTIMGKPSGYSLVDVINDLWSVSSDAIGKIKGTIVSTLNAVKDGLMYIAEAVLGPIIEAQVQMFRLAIKALTLVASELFPNKLTITDIANGISINGVNVEIFRDGLDFIFSVDGSEFVYKGTYLLPTPDFTDTLSIGFSTAYLEELIVSMIQLIASDILVSATAQRTQGEEDIDTASAGTKPGTMQGKGDPNNVNTVIFKLGSNTIRDLFARGNMLINSAIKFETASVGLAFSIGLLSLFSWNHAENSLSPAEFAKYNSEIKTFWLLNTIGYLWELGLGARISSFLTTSISKSKGSLIRIIELFVDKVPFIGERIDDVMDVVQDDANNNFLWIATLFMGILGMLKGYTQATILSNPMYIKASHNFNIAMAIISALLFVLHLSI